MFTFVDFWFPSILMGIGIAIDVAIATIVMFRNKELSYRNWTIPIMTTHILFPAAGYYLFWGLGATFAPLQVGLGILGAALVAAFLYEATMKWRGHEPAFAISEWMSKHSKGRGMAWLTPAILAVSWDALWSGPAKAAQAVYWTTNEVLASFLVAGVVVALVAQISLAIALWLRRIDFSSAETLARFNIGGKLAEVAVIGGFGVLALWNGIAIFLHQDYKPDIYISILIAGTLGSILFIAKAGEFWSTEIKEAEEAVEEESDDTHFV